MTPITEEIWLPVNGYENLYLVSNMGRVMNRITSKILRVRYTKGGYARVNLSKGGDVKTVQVHRLVGTHYAFAKKGAKPKPYVEEPYPITQKKQEDKQQRKEKAVSDKGLAKMEAFMQKFNKSFEERK